MREAWPLLQRSARHRIRVNYSCVSDEGKLRAKAQNNDEVGTAAPYTCSIIEQRPSALASS